MSGLLWQSADAGLPDINLPTSSDQLELVAELDQVAAWTQVMLNLWHHDIKVSQKKLLN